MNEHSFSFWLNNEVFSIRCALLTLYEKRDALLHIEGPRLEHEYMEKIGNYENTVIKEEIECELLQKKQQMMQIAINRREEIDEEAIDAKIEELRKEMMAEAMGSSTPPEYRELSSEHNEELQNLYKNIIENFHPQMHPDLTSIQKELFQKALEAYRRRDLDSLKLISELFESTKGETSAFSLSLSLVASDSTEANNSFKDYTTDYTLASDIYDCFKVTTEEITIKEEWEKYHSLKDSVMKEMEYIKLQFPYTAAEMLSDPEKIEDYKNELTNRLQAATIQRERRTKEIHTIMERVHKHG